MNWIHHCFCHAHSDETLNMSVLLLTPLRLTTHNIPHRSDLCGWLLNLAFEFLACCRHGLTTICPGGCARMIPCSIRQTLALRRRAETGHELLHMLSTKLWRQSGRDPGGPTKSTCSHRAISTCDCMVLPSLASLSNISHWVASVCGVPRVADTVCFSLHGWTLMNHKAHTTITELPDQFRIWFLRWSNELDSSLLLPSTQWWNPQYASYASVS